MTQSTEQERKLFEAVASDDGKWPQAIERDTEGNYLLLTTANGWMWWQAARRAPAAPVPQGWKLVPVELLDTEQPELLPCPLCGGDVKHEVWSDRNYHKVECQDCGLDVDYCNSYAELSEVWNRRTPVAQAQRAPLSDEQIFNIYCKSDSTLNTTSSNLTLFARAIEAAHGITQEKQG